MTQQDRHRRQQIIHLIGSRFDYGPTVKTAKYGDTRGPVADRWTVCTTCHGDAYLTDRFKRRQPCPACSSPCTACSDDDPGCRTCRGVGRVWPRGHRGELHVDSHTGDQVGSVQSGQATKSTATRRCDRCDGQGVWKHQRCELCDGTGRRPLPTALKLAQDDDPLDADDIADTIIKALARRDLAGSYTDLEKAMAGIAHHVNKPARFQILTLHSREALRLLDDLYLPPATLRETELSFWQSALAELALAYIESRMPDPIRVPADVPRNAKERDEQLRRVKGRHMSNGALSARDREIGRLVLREGRPSQWVAAEYGLSVSQVNRIVKGNAA